MELQLKLLENTLLPQILKGIEDNNPGFLSLVRISQDNNLFFPQLYESFFMLALNKSFYWSNDTVLENYSLFGLDSIQAGNLFTEFYIYNKDYYLNKIIKDNNSQESLYYYLITKIQSSLQYGLVLPLSFLEGKNLPIMSDDILNIIKNENNYNYQQHLDKILSFKNATNKKKI